MKYSLTHIITLRHLFYVVFVELKKVLNRNSELFALFNLVSWSTFQWSAN